MRGSDLLKEWGRIVKGVNTTADVGPGEIKKQAAKFGNKVDKDGKPPTLSKKVKGSKTNVLFNLGLAEGIILRLERDKHIDVLHIMDTNKKHRVEVRGKKGYESGNYDAQDKLHQVLDRVGKAANISELINGETVSINPNHPQGTRAIRTAQDVLQTERKFTDYEMALMEGGHSIDDWVCGKCYADPCVCESVKEPGDLFNALEEKWSQKYKRSINCNNPKGFSQKAHCAGRSKSESLEEALGQLDPSTEIYVDMDGVLADFFGEWSKSQGVDNWKDIENPAQAIGDIKTIDNFWLNLPVLPQATQLLSLIKKVKGRYKICTSPLADDPRSEPHKRQWVKDNLDFFPPDEVIVTHNKPQFATQEDGTPNILIDDYGVNINAWEEAGGIGFKYKDHKFERTAKAIKQAVGENFADGKKKGKSRPGRVKRSGASCNGSVTALRKRAKKASGEKAKMYHWCANMKSGRKKK